MHKNTYRMFVVGILCFMLTVGVIFGYRFGKDIAREDKATKFEISDDDNNTIIEDVAAYADYEVKEEFKIVKKIKYSLCSHDDYSEDIIISSSIDEALKQVDSNYKLESKSVNSAIVSKKIEGYCPNHYLIKLDENKIYVYRLLDEKNSEVYSNINVPINILREDILEDLKKGIEIYGIDELNKIVQELES